MNSSLRRALADSHVASIAILVLLGTALYQLLSALRYLLWPAYEAVIFLATAVAIRGVPSSSPWSLVDRLFYLDSASYLPLAVTEAILAWALSRWVFGARPLHSLRKFRVEILRRVNAPAVKDGAGR